MAKSGMTMEPTKGGNFAHNNREHKIDYLVEGDFFCDKTEQQAQETVEHYQAKGEEAFYEKSGEKYNVHRVSDNKVLKNKYYSAADLATIINK